MTEWKLRRNQAMSLQWTVFLLHKVRTKLESPDSLRIRKLLDYATDARSSFDYSALKLGCVIAVKVLIAFAFELALKSVIKFNGLNYPRTHSIIKLYNLIPKVGRQNIEKIYEDQCAQPPSIKRKIDELVSAINHQFVDWRYLDNAEDITNADDKVVQIFLSAILTYLSQDD